MIQFITEILPFFNSLVWYSRVPSVGNNFFGIFFVNKTIYKSYIIQFILEKSFLKLLVIGIYIVRNQLQKTFSSIKTNNYNSFSMIGAVKKRFVPKVYTLFAMRLEWFWHLIKLSLFIKWESLKKQCRVFIMSTWFPLSGRYYHARYGTSQSGATA